jgi:hypothetical protein
MPAVPSVTDLSDDRMKFRYVPKAKVMPTGAGIAKRRLQQTALALGTTWGVGPQLSRSFRATWAAGLLMLAISQASSLG